MVSRVDYSTVFPLILGDRETGIQRGFTILGNLRICLYWMLRIYHLGCFIAVPDFDDLCNNALCW